MLPNAARTSALTVAALLLAGGLVAGQSVPDCTPGIVVGTTDDAYPEVPSACLPDPAPSGGDADTLDGLDSPQFLRSDVAATAQADLTVQGTLHLGTGTGNGLAPSAGLLAPSSALFWGSAKVWTAAHQGSGSGLDADVVDGLDSTAFLRSSGKAADSDKLDGLDSTAFLGASGKAADSDRLDGLDSTAFLGASGKAADSDRLDGLDGTGYLKSNEAGLRVVRGAVNPTGGVTSGGGFTVTWGGCGSYTFTYTTAFSGTPTVLVGPDNTSPYFVSADGISASGGHVQTWNQAGSCDSRAFQFLAIGPA